MARKKGLGKGLDALFIDNQAESRNPLSLPLGEIRPNEGQPRKNFNAEQLAELADSLREHGLLQPLIVRPLASGNYQIVAGERRYRAARMLGWTEIPVVIREMDDREVMEVALIENLQREDLNPVEEALGYRELIEQYEMTQEQVAQRVGKSRSVVANAMRLLNLPSVALDGLANGILTVGQGKAILSFPSERMEEVYREIVQKGRTVRELERMAAREKKSFSGKERAFRPEDHYYAEMAIALEDKLHRKVKIEATKGEQGRLIIDFYNREELRELADKIAKMEEKGC